MSEARVISCHNIFMNEKDARKALWRIRKKYWEKECLMVDEYDEAVNAPIKHDMHSYGWTSLRGLKTWRDDRYFHINMTEAPKKLHHKKGVEIA